MENSRFKFRAWDEIEHEMLDADDMKYGVQYNDKTLSLISQKECFTFMQYTGLKDKNSIEIYEGDIVESKHSTMEVTFRDGSFLIVHCPTCRAETEGECKTDILDKLCIDIYNLEIIGNIYENKELLNLDGKTK